MDNQESDLQALRTLFRDLVARVERLERRAETGAAAAFEPPSRRVWAARARRAFDAASELVINLFRSATKRI